MAKLLAPGQVALLALALAGCRTPVTPPPAAATSMAEFFVTPIAERHVDTLPDGPLYWTIEAFPTIGAARAAQRSHSLVASADGRHWLFTLESAPSASTNGEPIARIGPVPVPQARSYLLRINRAGGPPGVRTPVHTHPGSEAIYVLRGAVRQRTAHGVEEAGAGQALNAHAPEMVMQLASSGDSDLVQLVMFVVDADRPFSPPARFPDE